MALHVARTRFAYRTTTALAIALFLAAPRPASAQTPSIMAAGDTIVSAFSGTVASPPPAGGNPVDETFIDLEGISVRIQRPQPAGPPAGQLIPSPTVFSAKARDVGQIFAIATDDQQAPNIYLGATSIFGVQIVVPDNDGDGRPERVKTGQAAATFMAGQWGPSGTGGSIYRIDGVSGAISLFTTIGANTGPGIGDLIFDPASRQFFVSDLDSGLIYRLDATGAIVDTYDHGTVGRPAAGLPAVADDGSAMNITAPGFNAEDPSSWGYTQRSRMVWGIAVYGGRIYYAAEGPRIFSIGIKVDGSFANDPRSEIDLAGLPNITPNLVSDIVFDGQGRMILAQRGKQRASYDYTVFAEPMQSAVLRLRREVPDDPATPGHWVPAPEEYAIGFRPQGRNSTGGIALGYGYNQTGQLRPGSCGAFLWTTGETLRDNPALAGQLGQPAIVHGLQGNGVELVRPQNDPPFSSYFTDYDGLFADPERQGHMGDVEVWQPCQPGQTGGYVPPYLPPYIPPYLPPPPYTPPGGSFNLTLDKHASGRDCVAGGIGWRCVFTIRVTNTGGTPYWGPITVEDWLPANPPGAVVDFAPKPPWACVATGPATYQCFYPPVFLFPGDGVDLTVIVDLPAGLGLCNINNGARLEWGFGVGDANPADDTDFASARIPDERCRPPEGQGTNLLIEKKAGDYCRNGETAFVCGFEITVTNTGPGIYNGNIVVTDTLSVPNNIIANLPWACTNPGPAHTCTYPGAVLIPGASVNLIIFVSIPKGQARELRICEVRNRAQITFAPGGSPQNSNAGDDDASAMTLIPGEHCDPPRRRSDLRISKEGIICTQQGQDPPVARAAVVVPAARGWLCTFVIKVFNAGPDPYVGPLTINDQVIGLPPGPPVFFWPPICAPAGPGYNCTAPGIALAPGAETAPLFVAVPVPANAEVCRIVNRARITNPPNGSAGNTGPGIDQAEASLNIPSERCQPQLMISPITACPIERQMPNSQCCPEGQRWNGRACVPTTGQPPTTCPPGTTGTPPNCRPIVLTCPEGSVGTPPNCRCPQGMVGTPPNCRSPQCPPGTVGTPPNCRPIVLTCPEGSVGTPPNCRCPAGMVGTPGNCRPPPQCPPGTVGTPPNCRPIVLTCPQGSVGTPPNCRCPQGMTGTPGNCRPAQCPEGMVGTPPNCRPIVQTCPRGSVGTPPNCRCPVGTTGTPGNCQPARCPQGMIGTPPNCRPIVLTCPQGSVGTPPNCRCPAGMTGTPGNCRPAQCPQGMVGIPPNCRTIVLTCPRGSVGTPPNCRCPVGTTGTPGNCKPVQATCPAGTFGVPPNCRPLSTVPR